MNHSIALYRGGGSIGITGAVRSALVVGHDPNDPHTLVLSTSKTNLGPMPRSLTYHLETVGSVARIAWGSECDLTANDILSHPPAGGKRTALEQCKAALRDFLEPGMRESDELTQTLVMMGYSESMIRRAKQDLGIQARRVGFGAEGRWMVSLPGREEAIPD
jgi:hypothetical protein